MSFIFKLKAWRTYLSNVMNTPRISQVVAVDIRFRWSIKYVRFINAETPQTSAFVKWHSHNTINHDFHYIRSKIFSRESKIIIYMNQPTLTQPKNPPLTNRSYSYAQNSRRVYFESRTGAKRLEEKRAERHRAKANSRPRTPKRTRVGWVVFTVSSA